MTSVILYTKKFELKFDKSGVSLTDVTALIEEVSKEYVLLDRSPTVTMENGFQYVTLKVARREDSKKIGFDFGTKA